MIIFKHPKKQLSKSHFLQFFNSLFKQRFSIAFTHILRQEIDGNDFAPMRIILKTWFAIAWCADYFIAVKHHKRVPVRLVKGRAPMTLGYTVRITLRNNTFISIFPALFIYILLISSLLSVAINLLITIFLPHFKYYSTEQGDIKVKFTAAENQHFSVSDS